MRIGLSYDLKETVPLEHEPPEDALEEYDCPETVDAIASALETEGHSVVRLGGGREFLTKILQHSVDLVFNIAEGRGNYRSREAQVPAVLEMLGIPYSGADPQCLANCLDKPLAKKILSLSGIATPRWQVVSHIQQLEETTWGGFPFPAFVKPAHEGSSKGTHFASRVENTPQMVKVVADLLKRYQQPVMVEKFVAGDEVTVGVVGNSPPAVLGIMRILPKRKEAYFFYSIEVKREWEHMVDYECPAQLGARVIHRIIDYSLEAFKVLGCRDFARIDFRLSPEGVPYFLEINPLPGLNPKSSDLPIMAIKMGWTYQALISAILSSALRRYPQCVPG